MIRSLISGLVRANIRGLVYTGGSSSCDVYLFSSANSDYLQIEPAQDLKVVFAATSNRNSG